MNYYKKYCKLIKLFVIAVNY